MAACLGRIDYALVHACTLVGCACALACTTVTSRMYLSLTLSPGGLRCALRCPAAEIAARLHDIADRVTDTKQTDAWSVQHCRASSQRFESRDLLLEEVLLSGTRWRLLRYVLLE